MAYDNFNNRPRAGTTTITRCLLAKSTDGGGSFSAPVKVSPYYDLPDCDTYQGPDPIRDVHACPRRARRHVGVPGHELPVGRVDRTTRSVVVTFGSYINKDSNESNGCTPDGFSVYGQDLYTGVKTPGALQQQHPDQRLQRRRRDVHGHARRPEDRGDRQPGSCPGHDRPVLAVAGVQQGRQARGRLLRPSIRQRRDDRLLGLQPVRDRRPDQLRAGPGHVELDAGADPVRRHGRRPVLRRHVGVLRPIRPPDWSEPGPRICSCVRAAGHRAIRRSCAARRRRTGWWRTTRRRSWRP